MKGKIILDTNLAVLLVVGLTDKDYIAKHKRLSDYDKIDFENIFHLISDSLGIIFTPNVLTETSNLIRYIKDPIKSEISKKFSILVEMQFEIFVESKVAVKHRDHAHLGLTDVALLELCKTGATLLTDDLKLYLSATKSGFKAINYNHIRGTRFDFK